MHAWNTLIYVMSLTAITHSQTDKSKIISFEKIIEQHMKLITRLDVTPGLQIVLPAQADLLACACFSETNQ
jgi:hypothetical protein